MDGQNTNKKEAPQRLSGRQAESEPASVEMKIESEQPIAPPGNRNVLGVALTGIGLAFLLPVGLTGKNVNSVLAMGPLLLALCAGTLWLLVTAVAGKALPRYALRLLTGGSPLILFYLLALLRNPDVQGVINLAQVFLVLLFTVGISLLRTTGRVLRPLLVLSVLFLGGHSLYWLLTGSGTHFGGPVLHPNALGFAAFTLVFVPLALKKDWRRNIAVRIASWISLTASAHLIFVSSSRGAWIACLAAFATYVSWPFLTRTRTRFWIMFLITLLTVVAGTLIYVASFGTEWGNVLNE